MKIEYMISIIEKRVKLVKVLTIKFMKRDKLTIYINSKAVPLLTGQPKKVRMTLMIECRTHPIFLFHLNKKVR